MNRRRAALLAGAAGLVSAGVTASKLVARRDRQRDDATAEEDFGELPPEEISPVVSFDGTLLHVRAAGDPSLPCLLFVHGFGVDMTTWHYQWKDLSKDHRCVLLDQRGHGRSGAAANGDHSLQATGRDVQAVIEATVPSDRPVVVLGHSMGGMSLLGLADTHPELFGSRIA